MAELVAPAPPRARIESVDLLRGVIMILMALDHVHEFFGNIGVSPTDLSVTTAPLFFTRWITHICAPVFFLLTGVGAYLALRRFSRAGLSRFLLTRGLWLVALELVVIRGALQFNLDYRVTVITVLWALGWAMVVLAGLIWLPLWGITEIGGAMVVGHNLLDGVTPTQFGALAPLWNVLHVPGAVVNTDRILVVIGYPLLPWVGVTALGYALGRVWHWEPARRRRLLGRLGLGLTAGFVLLRLANGYGDPAGWSAQGSLLWTVMSFVNTTKYPPSLLFLLMTLGPALLLLRLFDRATPLWLRPALVIGKVPLAFYVVHFVVIHLLAVGASWIRYDTVSGMFASPDLAHFPITVPPDWPASLPVVYLLWAVVVVGLYPACRWYAALKRRRTDWWLSYL
jgi:uncharacterized membrane protein